MTIGKLLYVENDPVSRRVMERRVRSLHQLYTTRFPASACEGFLTALPCDIRDVGERELRRHGTIHLVTISSPCQGLSRANRTAQGLADPRSALIFEAWRIVTSLTQRQDPPPGFI